MKRNLGESMPTISRRHSLQVAAASLLAIAAPRAASAQGLLSALKAIIDGIILIADALEVAETIEKWFHNERCDVSVNDLQALKSQCDLIAQLTGSEDVGLIPRLKAFLEKEDEQNWRRAKNALGILLNSGSVLISTVNAVAEKLNEKTYPGAYTKVTELKGAYRRVEGSIRAFAALPDKPEPDSVKVMASILEQVSRLPQLAKSATQQLQIATEERLKQKC
jgi:hypothetical protein